MKRLMILICLLNLFCVRATKSPFDPTSPSGLYSTVFQNSLTFSESTPRIYYEFQTYSFYITETVSILAMLASSSNIESCSVTPSLPDGLSLNSFTCDITGNPLIAKSTATYTVTAKNGTRTASVDLILTISPIYKTYITAVNYTGNLTTTADTICNSDALKPVSGTYKAVLVGSTRRACSTGNCTGGALENLDWVFKPYSSYFQSDGFTLVGKTNEAGIFWNGNFTTFTNSFSGFSNDYWTGMNLDFTNSTNNCSDWTSNSSGVSGVVGSSLSNDTALSSILSTCDSSKFLLCIEQ